MKIQNPKLLWQLLFEEAWPTAIAFLGDARRLAAGNERGEIFVWNLPETPPEFTPEQGSDRQAPDHPPVRRLDGHSNGVTRMVATRDGQRLISSSLDHTVRIWEPESPATGGAEAVLDGNQRQNRAKRERNEAILSAPGVRVETLTAAHVLAVHKDWVLALGISADERRLISGDAAARVVVWDLARHEPVSQWTGLPWNWIQATALSGNGELAVVAESRYKRDDFDIPAAALRVVDTATGEVRLDILQAMFPKYNANDASYGAAQVWRKFVAGGLIAADISPDGRLAALGQGGETDMGKVQLLELATGKLVRELSGHQYGVTDVKFSGDGKLVLSTGRDTTLRICEVESGAEVAALGAPRGGQFKDWLSALAISPDQGFVAATDIAGRIHLWALAT